VEKSLCLADPIYMGKTMRVDEQPAVIYARLVMVLLVSISLCISCQCMHIHIPKPSLLAIVCLDS